MSAKRAKNDKNSEQSEQVSAEAIPQDDNTAAAEEGEAGSLQQQLTEAQQTVKEYWDQIMRLRAEMENNRKRAERDVEAAHKFALKGFIENLLPVIDSMEMGQAAAVADNATLESIREGNSLTMTMLVQALEKAGLEQINPLGESFDPERHQAISMIDHAEVESNRVIEVMQKGFALNDRLVRPAMVVVAK